MVSESRSPLAYLHLELSRAEWNEGIPLCPLSPRWLVAEMFASEILVWLQLIVL